MQTLQLRLTHVYADTWRHEDKYENIGEYSIRTKDTYIKVEEDGSTDITEPMKVIYLIDVESKADQLDVRRALAEMFTNIGCHHEYDCCGCRSFYAKAFPQDYNGLYRVEVNSMRNY
jgi:hypothetical protein